MLLSLRFYLLLRTIVDPLFLRGTVTIVSTKRAAKSAHPICKGWRISVCAVILLLLSATSFAPPPYTLGTCNCIHSQGLNGLPNLALQNRLVGSVALSKALRATGSYSQVVHSAAISANDLPLPHSLPRMIELDQASFPTTKSVVSTIKVRAPPFRTAVSIL